MKRWLWLCCNILWLVPQLGTAQTIDSIGLFHKEADIGTVAISGQAAYNPLSQAYWISGSGSNVWDRTDAFHYLYTKLSGDFILYAEVHWPEKSSEPHRKAGWMIRSSLDAHAASVVAAAHGNGLISLQYRAHPNGIMAEQPLPADSAWVLQLERQGHRYILAAARLGDTLQQVEVDTVDLPDTVYVGLFVCAHQSNRAENAVFRNVRIIRPAPANLIPYHDYLGSYLEILDVHNGHRWIVYADSGSLQAPNWTKDGQSLIFNKEGHLYRLSLITRQITLIPTGDAVENNNDHVISFDGKWLGISNTPRDSNTSHVYVVPISGGDPRLITPQGPSYLHGWSPDGKYLVYTAQRNGEFDIYRIPVQGGKEQRLTDAPGLDDGPEYSPDGAYIYFNSVRSGNMQIWRMHADGSSPQQLTHDDFQNWFPHVSPDGKWIVFLSYLPEVHADDHPFYKKVYIRIMPADGGLPRVLAYVYGGQGTINTPS
ncbi:MAG: TolB family protein, partial [Thermoflavifilum sp.]|nr:TolB family protein [Thermoflavifilum sp.]